MFQPFVNASHEDDAAKLVRLILFKHQSGDPLRLKTFLKRRDRKRRLKIDASHVNIYLLEELLVLFPGSKYVLTYRHPLEWLRSMIDDSLRRDAAKFWHDFRDFRFGPKANSPHESALVDAGLYSIRGYLSYWRDAIEVPMNRIPPQRLLPVRTDDLHRRSREIALFCEVEGFVPDPTRSHAYVNHERFGILSKLDREYVREMTDEICGPLLRTLFPDVNTDQVLRRIVNQDP